MWGPQTNDLVLQLRKRRFNRIILAGTRANLCVERRLRKLLEQSFGRQKLVAAAVFQASS